jgi:hypothetical protein
MKDFTYRKLKDYMLFKCTAKYEKELFKSYILFVKKILDEKHMDSAILDLRQKKGEIPVFDRYELAELIANACGSRYFIAVLDLKCTIDKFTENVAANRGANYFASDDINEIKKWLKSQ